MILDLNNFENQLAQLANIVKNAPQPVDHVVMNCHKSCKDAVLKIKTQIQNAQPHQLLYKLDLRTIFHSEGVSENWSLEACSSTKSLAIIGDTPTA